MEKELKLFSGKANPALAKEICAYLGISIGEATVSSFSDGEARVRIDENVRGADVFVMQSTCPPVNDSIMELLIMIDALKRSSAYRITAVIPYFGYARQDRKDQPRVPISAKLIADLITTAGADRVLTMAGGRALSRDHEIDGVRGAKKESARGRRSEKSTR